jgi:hypothetical protein
MLWNMVDGREKTELYQVYEAVMKELELPVLKTFTSSPGYCPKPLLSKRECSTRRSGW